jgi:hypothetical protein
MMKIMIIREEANGEWKFEITMQNGFAITINAVIDIYLMGQYRIRPFF